MAPRRHIRLLRINDAQPLTPESSPEFRCLLQRALLLALREQGALTPMKHRHAEEALTRQYRKGSGQP